MWPLSHSSPTLVGWGGESEGKAKLVGWDKNSLTEWQREKKITTIILTKRIYSSMQCSNHPIHSWLPRSKSPCFSQLPT